jgi:hypothetical protein
MSRNEARQAHDAARAEGKFHSPRSLWYLWKVRNEQHIQVPSFVSDLRDRVSTSEFDDPELAPKLVARLMEALTMRFELLLEGEELGSALPQLNGLPMLFSPYAGKGGADFTVRKRLA